MPRPSRSVPHGSPPSDDKFKTPSKKEPQDIPDVSPADTAITADESFETSTPRSGNDKNNNNSVVTIQHKVQNRSSTGMIMGMSKPALAAVMLVVFGTGGAFAFTQWFRIPALDDQIEELTAEVDRLNEEVSRLTTEVDRLTEQNDRLEGLNNRLNVSVTEFESLNMQLNASNIRLEGLVFDLNGTSLALNESVQDLQLELAALESVNEELAETNEELSTEVDRLEEVSDVLEEQNNELEMTTTRLTEETAELRDANSALNLTAQGLSEQVDELEAENGRLSELNDNFETIVGFLNQTATNLDDSYEDLANELATQITSSRTLLLERLELLYEDRLISWDCSFRDTFRGADFVSQDVPIGAASYDSVMDYVEAQVLVHLCLDRTDLEAYLAQEIVPPGQEIANITVDQLVRGVRLYTTGSIDYYFDGNPGGLSLDEWAEASYDCINLPEGQAYLWAR